MPRIGMNPSRNRDTGFSPAKVTAGILTHVPHGEGYFEHRFEVLRLCIESLIITAGEQVDVMIFDNASSPEVVEYLNAIQPEYRQDGCVADDSKVRPRGDHRLFG
jgi:hypothetical protein